jgi:uroporphyrinogen decarboxylase
MNDSFLKACRGEPVPHTPVWVMRQGGRSIPRFREMMDKYGFLDICRVPELAAEATMIPIDSFGVDAVILFSDILTTPVPMGMDMVWDDIKGPGYTNPVRSMADVERLIVPDPEDGLAFVMQAADICKRELEGKMPNMGFAGAPFTVAAYMVEGGPSSGFHQTRKMLFTAPEIFEALVSKVARLTAAYLKAQVKHGVDAAIIFDSLAKIIGHDEYARFALPYARQVFDAVKETGVPTLYYVNGFAALTADIHRSGADVLGLDWRTRIDDVLKILGNDVIIQGNLDPFALHLPPAAMEARVKDILDMGKPAKGHIFNLGEGVMPGTPVELTRAMVETVHRLSQA